MLSSALRRALAPRARGRADASRLPPPGGSPPSACRRHPSSPRAASTPSTPGGPALADGAATLRILEPTTAELEAKRSRFVARAAPAASPALAMRFVEAHSDASASHNCFAYKISEREYRFSDDGEPGGSAGRPILAAIEGAGFENVVVVVTRYYGGTQLGVGGLRRAYGGAAKRALEKAPSEAAVSEVDAIVTAPSPDALGAIYACAEKHGATREDEEFPEDGSVWVQLVVEKGKADALGEALRDATRGAATFRVLDD